MVPVLIYALTLILNQTNLNSYGLEYLKEATPVCDGCIGLPAPETVFIGTVSLVGNTLTTITSAIALIYFALNVKKLKK